jgi:translocation and assembly module TamB
VVNFVPLDLPVSEGRLKLAPRLMLNSSPMLMVLDKGPLIEQMRISPEMCQTWLKYVAPMLADATQAEGKFSVNLSSAAIPLASPEAGDVQGVLTIHSAQVGPGPLSREFLTIAKQVKAIVEKRPLDPASTGISNEWLTMPQQNIDFQMRDGRVSHRGLELHSKDVVIRTHGSVGTDQTLSLVAEVPIRDEWVASDRILIGLKGQTLQIPIQGTLSQPKVDARVLEQLTKQMIGGAAKGLLEQELNKGLERLFRPKN